IPPDCTAAAVYIIRNPFDVVLSYARHMNEDVDAAIRRMTDPKAINVMESGISEFVGRWDEHLSTWLEAPGLPRHVMRYEDMVADIERSTRGMLEFLRVPVKDGQMRRAIRAASFESLQKQEREKGFRERPGAMKQFFKTGRAGSWRRELTPEQVARLRAEFLPALERHYPEMLEETAQAAASA
ncbi:MAG TPA: sulfotransferase domain-containing protein, partial [Paracoccaceae bacterium]|nr:sulfotransferase domain-containing protein [Paracoccaceae bacterium]